MVSPRLVLLHALGQASRARAAAEFRMASRDMRRVQERKLFSLLQAHAGTEYGTANRFGAIKSLREYSERVPVLTPELLHPLVERLRAGERNILSAEPPIYYVRTTGSTGEPKHVPITVAYRAEFQKTVQVSLYHLYWRFPQAFTSRALYFVGSRRVEVAKDGNDIGTMSGFNFTTLPPAIQKLYAWPYRLFEVADLDSRNFLALLLATVGDPSVIAGIFPASIVYLLRDFERFAPELLAAARNGTLPAWLQLSPEQREFFATSFAPGSALATRVERAGHAPLEERIQELWPKLRLVYCWASATAAMFLPELQRRLGPKVAVRDAIYSACEGWCSIPMGDEEPGGALAITSHFFEFFEEASYERGERKALYAWELEDKKRYFIVFSTGAGLHRYFLGDLIEVCGFFGAVPKIRFVRKRGAATNLAGEKFEEVHITEAVNRAAKACNLELAYFVAVPGFEGSVPGYTLYVEPAGAVSPASREEFSRAADESLGAVSFDYGRLRKSKQLSPLAVHWANPGQYSAYRQRMALGGTAEAQLKVANLVSELEKVPAELRATATPGLRLVR